VKISGPVECESKESSVNRNQYSDGSMYFKTGEKVAQELSAIVGSHGWCDRFGPFLKKKNKFWD